MHNVLFSIFPLLCLICTISPLWMHKMFMPFGLIGFLFNPVTPFCANITIIHTSVTPIKSQYEANDKAKIACIEGYKLNGTEEFTCKADDTWDPVEFPNCVYNKPVDIEKLRKMSYDGARKQKYWINWKELGVSKGFMTVVLIMFLILLSVALSYGSHMIFNVIISKREAKLKKAEASERERDERNQINTMEQRRRAAESVQKRPEDDDVVGISFQMDSMASTWVMRTKFSQSSYGY